jgi:predicted DNA-binding protein
MKKAKRNRKKIFPRTIVIKISEESYDNVMKLTEKSGMTKSESFREIIRIGVNSLKKD